MYSCSVTMSIITCPNKIPCAIVLLDSQYLIRDRAAAPGWSRVSWLCSVERCNLGAMLALREQPGAAFSTLFFPSWRNKSCILLSSWIDQSDPLALANAKTFGARTGDKTASGIRWKLQRLLRFSIHRWEADGRAQLREHYALAEKGHPSSSAPASPKPVSQDGLEKGSMSEACMWSTSAPADFSGFLLNYKQGLHTQHSWDRWWQEFSSL